MPSTHLGMIPAQRFEPMLVDDKHAPTLLPPLIFEEKWHSRPSSPLSKPSGRKQAPPGELFYPRRPVLPPTPPSSPRFAAVQPLNTQKMRDVCTFVPLALEKRPSFSSDRSQLSTPGLSDSFSASSSSDDDDTYHASTTSLWDSYYANAPPQAHNLPFVRSCHDLSVRYIAHAPPPLPTSSRYATAPTTPITPLTPTTPVTPTNNSRKPPPRRPLRHQASFPIQRTTPAPDVFKALPPTPPRTASMYNARPAVRAGAAPRTPPPLPRMPAAYARPASPPPRLALFPACETLLSPPTRPGTAETPVEKSVWEEDEEDRGGLGMVARKLHIRSLSAGNSGKEREGGRREKEGGRERREKEREREREGGGRRSAGEVVRGLFRR